MKYLKSMLTSAACIGYLQHNAQNLVTNPDFEVWDTMVSYANPVVSTYFKKDDQTKLQ
jgi:hypothetical protein